MKHQFFELAKKMAMKSTHHQYKIGGVLVKKNRILSVGFNKLKTHTRSTHPFKTTHCELDVILACPREDLEGSTLYLFRSLKTGGSAMSKPCQYCMELIREAKIKKVIFTNNNGYEELLIA